MPRGGRRCASAERIDDQSGRTDIRSFLPYTLHLVLRREVEDRSSGHLRVEVSGDLEGWCEWRVRNGDNGSGASVAEFDQEAIVTPMLLARTARRDRVRCCGPTTRG